ncbi:MAG: leucine-rich repeat domain-containing protein [Clostridia bacterium]|nr:leucine-rich repeat domain-containing protein [Clostridia bacterium]
MKRKIIFAFMVMALMACLFAVSASAATLIDGIYYDLGTTEATVSSNNQKNCQLEVVVIPEKVTYNGTEYDVTAITTKAFGSGNSGGGNSYIKSVTIPSTVTTVGEYAFGNCPNIEEVYCSATQVGSRMFFDCNKLTTLVLENTVEIGQYAFTRVGITSVILPATVTTFSGSGYTFKECSALTKVVVLGSTTGNYMLNSCSAVNTLVLTENFTTFGTACLGNANNKQFVTYYTGIDYERIIELGSSTSRFSQAGTKEYVGYGNENYTDKTYMVAYGANLCEVAFDGAHAEDGNPCVVNCDRCGTRGAAQANPVHNESVIIEYKNGYHNAGEKITGCTNEGCEYCSKEEVAAIFECLGYSTNDASSGIATGFVINHESLSTYESAIGKKLTFGVVIFNPKYLGEDTLFTSEGLINTSKGALQVEFDLTYANCNLSISGMNLANADHASLELVFAGYAYEGEDVGSAKVFQKEYIGTTEDPISSPMASKVTRGSDVLYTIKLQSVLTPAQISFGKEGLNEF